MTLKLVPFILQHHWWPDLKLHHWDLRIATGLPYFHLVCLQNPLQGDTECFLKYCYEEKFFGLGSSKPERLPPWSPENPYPYPSLIETIERGLASFRRTEIYLRGKKKNYVLSIPPFKVELK